jgi:Rieske Fe-S protein
MPSDEETTVQQLPNVGRRTLLAGGAGLAAAVVLAGCGDDATPGSGSASDAPADDPETPDAGGEKGDGGTTGGTELGDAAAVAVGSGVIFAEQNVVVTQPTEGEFRGFDSICTHQGCPVSDVTDTINCNCHGSQFSLEDGSVVSDPATKALPAKQVTVVDGKILLA